MSECRRHRSGLLFAPRRPGFWIAVSMLAAAGVSSSALPSGAPDRASQSPPRIFIDDFQGKVGATQLRSEVIARLRASHEVRVVEKDSDAELVVRGAGEIWLKGYVAINPHPTASVRQPVYGGYLSLEVADRSGAVLWSYLVTPGRVHWNGVDADMADHIVRLMLAALRRNEAEIDEPSQGSGDGITLAGAGSTFAAPLYQAWIDSFEGHRPEVRATYQSVGSENGIHLLEEGKVDFAASDVPVPDAQMAAMPVKFHQYATVLGGVVPAYNLAGIGRDLRFTPELLAEIYLGTIRRWSDSRLRSLDGGAGLPDEPIVVLHRSDGSGTSFAWTEFLSSASAEWKTHVGAGMRVAWPAGEGVEGNEGVAAKVAQTPGAIGYVELTYAIRHELSFGEVRNAAGRYVQADLESLSAAAKTTTSERDLRQPLIDARDKDAYPVATLTWILLPASTADAKKSAALQDLLQWMLTSGQKECSGLGYVPLPKDLAAKQLDQARRAAGSPAR